MTKYMEKVVKLSIFMTKYMGKSSEIIYIYDEIYGKK